MTRFDDLIPSAAPLPAQYETSVVSSTVKDVRDGIVPSGPRPTDTEVSTFIERATELLTEQWQAELSGYLSTVYGFCPISERGRLLRLASQE